MKSDQYYWPLIKVECCVTCIINTQYINTRTHNTCITNTCITHTHTHTRTLTQVLLIHVLCVCVCVILLFLVMMPLCLNVVSVKFIVHEVDINHLGCRVPDNDCQSKRLIIEEGVWDLSCVVPAVDRTCGWVLLYRLFW